MIDIYGGQEHLDGDIELAIGQSDKQFEYTFDGHQLRLNNTLNRKTNHKLSKYEEDIYYNNHTSIWGSWWNEHLGWGYKCCHSNTKLSEC